MGDKCGSWPWCDLPAAPGGRFCEFHQRSLDRVKASISGRKFTGNDKPLPPTVKVSHVAPDPRPKRKRAPKYDAATAARAEARNRERALALARLVVARGRLRVPEAAEALKVSSSVITTTGKICVREGWIETKPGPTGGYLPGAVLPPVAAT